MRLSNLIPVVVLIGSAGCSPASQTETDQAAQREDRYSGQDIFGRAALINSDGMSVGSATLKRSAERVTLALDLQGVPAGSHALHLHETGACDGPDFKSAGGHLNPSGKSHGKLNSNGKHLGDLPNIDLAANGEANTSVEIGLSYADFLPHLFDEDGTAVVLHADADDYRSDPAGAAGPRIACGVFERAS